MWFNKTVANQYEGFSNAQFWKKKYLLIEINILPNSCYFYSGNKNGNHWIVSLVYILLSSVTVFEITDKD